LDASSRGSLASIYRTCWACGLTEIERLLSGTPCGVAGGYFCGRNTTYPPALAARVGQVSSGPKYWTPAPILDAESMRTDAPTQVFDLTI
jgi:hypothetical protein